MSTIHISAAELAPVVHVMAAAFDGARGTMTNLPRAAALLAPALIANARAYNATMEPGQYVAGWQDDELLLACSQSYCIRNGLRRDTPRALRALGALRYNSGALLPEEHAAMLDAFALCSRVAAQMLTGDNE